MVANLYQFIDYFRAQLSQHFNESLGRIEAFAFDPVIKLLYFRGWNESTHLISSDIHSERISKKDFVTWRLDIAIWIDIVGKNNRKVVIHFIQINAVSIEGFKLMFQFNQVLKFFSLTDPVENDGNTHIKFTFRL